MAKSKLVQANEKIAESVVDGYKKIENGVVNGYKKIETGVVEGFTKMTDHFVDQFLTKEGETVAEAKARLAREQAQREASRAGAEAGKPTACCVSIHSKSMENHERKVCAMNDLRLAIKDRLENGFKSWNGGYDGWLEWCNTLYEPDAHYNVYGHRLTLQQYKDMMGQLFQHYTMELGDFQNMLIQDDWAAIRYTVKVKNLDTGEEILQNTMEFVNFKENPEPVGVRVVEGWALSDSPLSAH